MTNLFTPIRHDNELSMKQGRLETITTRIFIEAVGNYVKVSHLRDGQVIKHCHESLPVSRSNMAQVKAAIYTTSE